MKKALLAVLVILAVVSLTFTASADSSLYTDNKDFLWGINIHGPASSRIYKLTTLEDQVHLAAEMGVKIIRIDITDATDINYIDNVVELCNMYGIKLMFALTACVDVNSPETAKIVTNGYAERYNGKNGRGKVDFFQLKNEIDVELLKEGGGGDGSTLNQYKTESLERYRILYAAMQAGIDEADTDAQSVINFGWTHYAYLQYMRDAGLQWDIVGLDWYEDMNIRELGGYLEFLSGEFPEQNFIICESNSQLLATDDYSDLSNWEVLLSFMDTAYNYAKQNARFKGFIVYELFDAVGNTASQFEANYGVLYADIDNDDNVTLEKKAIYNEIQRLIGGGTQSKIKIDDLDMSPYHALNQEDETDDMEDDNEIVNDNEIVDDKAIVKDKVTSTTVSEEAITNQVQLPDQTITEKQVTTRVNYKIPWVTLILSAVGLLLVAAAVIAAYLFIIKRKMSKK